MKHRFSLLALDIAVCCVVLSAPVSSRAFDFPGELLLFPGVEVTHASNLPEPADRPRTRVIPSIDLFYSIKTGRFRALTEVFLGPDEQELERFQLGWDLRPDTTVWFGRFHNPLSFWNTEFHHGLYFQTSISRPGIEEFEDEGGPLPVHISGLLVEYTHIIGDSSIEFDLGLGFGPSLESDGLEPVDLLDPVTGKHRIGISGRLTYRPFSVEKNAIGVISGFSQIASNQHPLQNVDQFQLGLFGALQYGPWSGSGALYFVHDRLDLQKGKIDSGSFFNAYGQLEYTIGDHWTFYSRYEETFLDNDPYLDRLPSFTRKRILGGFRFDFARQHAFTLEFSKDHIKDGSFGNFVLRWSALFP